MEYPKIHSLYKREGWYFDQAQKVDNAFQETRQSLIPGDYAEPEFENVKKWRVVEKIDGTNIRIIWQRMGTDGELSIRFGGRTKNAQIPCHLLDYLQTTFTSEILDQVFPIDKTASGILFGEGFGPKIQKGGEKYQTSPGFILFDALIGNWWLKYEDVKAIAQQLGIPVVPDLGIMTEEEVVDFVKSKPESVLNPDYGCMEGVVCRTEPMMLFRKGTPVIFKLKCKEFV